MNAHPATWDVDRLLAECTSRRQRRSGPGGQHRNKVETAVVVTHRPTNVQGEASERRSQEQNRQMAVFRLRVNLALRERAVLDLDAGGPSRRWRTRCPNGRIAVNPRHEDFPALLAEALDVLHAAEMDVKRAATWLACSPSQLTRFLKRSPRALDHVNAARRAAGLHALK
ncbi:MAG: peptide chain release factor-like protein [Pirellulaceae bacterium]